MRLNRLNPFRSPAVTTSIGAWGNSAALRLPAAIMKKVGWTMGQAVEVAVEDGRVTLHDASPESSGARDDGNEYLLMLMRWAQVAREHGDVPVVVRVYATHATVTLNLGSQGQQPLMELRREDGLNALSVAFNVLAVGGDVAFFPSAHQKALIRWAPAPEDLSDEEPLTSPPPSLNWWWKSHPVADGVVVVLTPATPMHGYRVGMGDREGTLGEVREVLDTARWAALGEPPVTLEQAVLRMVGTLGQVADPERARQGLLDLAAQALVAVETLDAATFDGPFVP